jgi:hypothetical protein
MARPVSPPGPAAKTVSAEKVADDAEPLRHSAPGPLPCDAHRSTKPRRRGMNYEVEDG